MVETNRVCLSLGSNLGNREANLDAAVSRLATQVRIDALSSLYETDPMGVEEQPAFLNRVVTGTTRLLPADLLKLVKHIEREIGRVETFRWGPRLIDIDIVLFGDLVLSTADLTIPHPEMHHRAFVLVPLAELAPDTTHPVSGKSMAELRDEVGWNGVVRRGD